jgi:hypothetical protein
LFAIRQKSTAQQIKVLCGDFLSPNLGREHRMDVDNRQSRDNAEIIRIGENCLDAIGPSFLALLLGDCAGVEKVG